MTETEKMLEFINKSPTCFHAVENTKNILLEEGFVELKENEKWSLQPGKKYFVSRNDSAIISFVLPENEFQSFYICASHSDSPCFKIKENPEIRKGNETLLNIEKYGGMLIGPWFDRPLSIAGRISYCPQNEKKDSICIKSKLINFDRDLAYIPNLAIHMKRDANEDRSIDLQNEVLPVISSDPNFSFIDMLADQAEISKEEILSYDLFLYNRDKGTFWGKDQEFISSPRLDDLECLYSTLKGFIQAANEGKQKNNIMVHAVFDNEEVGSQSRQGAASSFLKDCLQRINLNLGRNLEDYNISLAKSFLISADNAHAMHPNYSYMADPINRPVLNGGPVIKFNASQKYTSDAMSAGIFKKICEKAGVPYQIYTNNSNIPGGSTLGNISLSQVSLLSVDIGIAQWAMHSPNESAGSYDVILMEKAIKEFYSSQLNFD
ncbi:MAG: M18 family aminopeptidase [Treponemataceae bacterium]|nr:M18 family aminopeptidase [Treponemataceae bacterium]